MRLFVDSPVFLYALGRQTQQTAGARALLQRALGGDVELHTGAECIQEIAYHRRRTEVPARAVAQVQAIRDLCTVHAMDGAVLERGLSLILHHDARGRDAFIAATALLAGFDAVVTTDDRFVEVPGLRRIHPRDLAA
jgi:predicted nucleic acid-binding protein